MSLYYVLHILVTHNIISIRKNRGANMNEVTLFKPNELISAIDQINVNKLAKHLCNYFLQHAQKKLKFENYNSNSFELSISEINHIANIGVKDYKMIEKSINALMQPVTIRPVDDPKSYIKLVPIYMVALDNQKGVYKFSLVPEVIDILKNSDYFTKLNLSEFNYLESKYSIILYEYLKRYENARKIPLMTIDEFRTITHTQDKKTYDNFAQLKRTVLDVAVNDINNKTQYNVSYETYTTHTRRRPKISEIQFYFSKKARLESEQATDNEFNDELFISFRQIFKNLPIEDYKHACETFERSTLVRFLNDLKNKSYSSLKTECFLRYLLDRTNKKWNGYLYKTQNKTPKEPGQTSGSFGANEKFNFDEYMKKERQKFFDV